MEQWKDIPGYDGMYQINERGQVRSWRWRGSKRSKEPRMMTLHRSGTGTCMVRLTSDSGDICVRSVPRLMADTWLGGVPEGCVAFTRNGMHTDLCVENIGIRPRRVHSRENSKKLRKPVEMVDRSGEVVACYPSLSAAAKANYMTPCAVGYYCRGRNTKLYNGKYTFRYVRLEA